MSRAAREGDVAFLRAAVLRLVAEGADCEEVQHELFPETEDGRNVAHVAAEHGRLEFLILSGEVAEWVLDEFCDGADSSDWALEKMLLEEDADGQTPTGLVLAALLREPVSPVATAATAPASFGDRLFSVLTYLYEEWQASANEILRSEPWPRGFAAWLETHTLRPWELLKSRASSPGFAGLMPPGARQLSQQPPVFELQELLTASECEAVVADAELLVQESTIRVQDPVAADDMQDFLEGFDKDGDGVLNAAETKEAMDKLLLRAFGVMSAKAVEALGDEVAKLLHIDLNEDGAVDLEMEAFATDEESVESFQAAMGKIKARLKNGFLRSSLSAFMPSSLPSIKAVIAKMQAAIGLEAWMVAAAESMQVVRYEVGGHYGAHMDGQQRRATVYTYLSNVPRGGSTMFPFANLSLTKAQMYDDMSLTSECNQDYNCCSERCRAVNVTVCKQERDRRKSTAPMTHEQYASCLREEAAASAREGIQVEPRRGSTVMWFNYDVSLHGGRDPLKQSKHCGCDVEEGTKWGSNLWLKDAPLVTWAVKFAKRVAHARREGRRRGLASLAELGDASFDLWTSSELTFNWEDLPEGWLQQLVRRLRRELLGISGPGGRPSFMYRRSPNLAQVRSLEDHLRAAVYLHESLNITKTPAERELEERLDTNG